MLEDMLRDDDVEGTRERRLGNVGLEELQGVVGPEAEIATLDHPVR